MNEALEYIEAQMNYLRENLESEIPREIERTWKELDHWLSVQDQTRKQYNDYAVVNRIVLEAGL